MTFNYNNRGFRIRGYRFAIFCLYWETQTMFQWLPCVQLYGRTCLVFRFQWLYFSLQLRFLMKINKDE